jgi:hypothetical protein
MTLNLSGVWCITRSANLCNKAPSIQNLTMLVRKFQNIALRQPITIKATDAILVVLLFFAISSRQKPAIRKKNNIPSCIYHPQK